MSHQSGLIILAVVCCGSAAGAIWYLCTRAGPAPSLPAWVGPRNVRIIRRRAHRRRLGMALVVLVSVMFLLGSVGLDPQAAPGRFILFWLLLAALVVWLFGLAIWDLAATLRLRRQLQQDAYQQLHRLISSYRPDQPTRPDQP